ncbi:MAG: UvrD-helicase domain-containing protein [Patescibacteria group bacterium]|nr:UvrD-helicase domain-containing protein [Patescibacteria group bacterium]
MNEKKFLAEYKKLNLQQKKAVDEIEGPVMVIAGPGTGKTQILAMRIANILRVAQVNPSNILCLTFTNSGVQAMKERLLEIIGPSAYQVQVYTFHAFCNEVINTFPEKFLLARTINQLDDLEQVFVIQKILDSCHFKFLKPLKSPYYYQKTIITTISQLKQENISPQKFITILKQEKESLVKEEKDLAKTQIEIRKNQLGKNKELAEIYKLYQNHLQKEGKYDYNDMILFVVSAFKTDPELLSYYQEKFHYILIDEYQDTNTAQNEITKLLASFYEIPNIFVVGDDEQSIFRFQGASMENILVFKENYPLAKIIVLKSNYRSGQKILDASRILIGQNKNQIFNRLKIPKKLKSQIKNIKGEIKVAEFSNGSNENFFIAKEILYLIKTKKAPFSEIAVLFRENRDSEELIDFLSKLNIPYQIENGENIFDDPEIKKLINFFKVLNTCDNPKDNEILFEIMHYPFFKIPPLDIYKIAVAASKHKKNIFTILTANLKSLNLEKEKKIKNFLKLILDCREIAHNNTFSSAFEIIINHSGYLDYLISLEDIRHLNRLQTLFKYIQNLNLKQKDLNLKKFLEHLELLEDNQFTLKEEAISSQIQGVRLMTAHKSKGLEFDFVFLLHLTDGHWGQKTKRQLIKLPNLLQIQKENDDNDEEERRLFYVSLTRARIAVYLTFAKQYGELESQTFTMPSKFISELPPETVEKIDTVKYERQFDERLKLKFQTKKWRQSKNLTDFLKAILVDFKLNPTAFNTFLECPQRFFYDNILRVPKAKDFNQSYGTAIHFALERFFKKYKQELIMPSKTKLIGWFKEGLKEEILIETDYKRALKQGSEVLKNYYDFYVQLWQERGVPLFLEFNFGFRNVHFGNIPITGRVDKIELIDSISNKVRLIDYKTSAPKSLNYLLGLTKEKNLSLFYQAYFYKLLAEVDSTFNWQVGEIVFDFISPQGFKQVVLPIEEKKYQEFKQLVQKIYQQITKLDFIPQQESCQKQGRICDYFNICQNQKFCYN